MVRLTLVVFAILAPVCLLADVQASAERGPSVLRDQGCINCHAVGAIGPTVSAMTLSRPLNREYTPAGLTATLWNHAPAMWGAIAAKGMKQPQLSEQDAADVFAYFASLRYFEPMGEASRGARLFESKKCAECHATGAGVAKTLAQWDSLGDPIELVGRMWNHVPQMRAQMLKRSIKWPTLTSHELSDILVYARGMRKQSSQKPVMLDFPQLAGAETLIGTYQCTGCHKGDLSLDRRLADRTLTDVAAAMWNHGPHMAQLPPAIAVEDMRKIVLYIWARQFLYPAGSPAKGRQLVESRKCVTCHESGGGPAPAFTSLQGPYSVVKLTSALWRHGPRMLSEMKAKGVSWPRFTPADVENLIAYIDSKNQRAAR